MDPTNQWKKHRSKLYRSKAKSHANLMKCITSKPTINSLSRKVADLVTRRELKMLGIHSADRSPKQHYTLPKKPRQKKTTKNDRALVDLRANDLSPIDYQTTVNRCSSELIIEELEMLETNQARDIKLENNLAQALTESQKQSNTVKLTLEPKDLKNIKISINKVEFKRRKTLEMMKNLEHVEALREELNRDYPELNLNNSYDGSSFHTSELRELEEVSKEVYSDSERINMNSRCTEKEKPGIDDGLDKEGINEGPSSIKHHESLELESVPYAVLKPVQKLALSNSRPTQVLTKHFKLTDLKIASDTPKKSTEFTPLNSKFHSTFHEFPSKGFENLQNSYMKATVLHSPQAIVPVTTPRCHVNLATFKSTPIYLNYRLSQAAKIKSDNGIAVVESLRSIHLKTPEAQDEKQPKDFYTKNLEWYNQKEERASRIRASMTEQELSQCTFQPFASFGTHRKISSIEDSKTPRHQKFNSISETASQNYQQIKSSNLSPKSSAYGTIKSQNLSPKSSVHSGFKRIDSNFKSLEKIPQAKSSKILAHHKKIKSTATNLSPNRNPKQPRLSLDSRATLNANPSLPQSTKAGPSLTTYSALSPALVKFGYKEGCEVEKILEKAKPMVNYRSINFLN